MATEVQDPSYERDVRPLIREKDRDSMRESFDLWSYEDVSANAEDILRVLSDGSMPCDGAWPQEHVETFRRWVAAGSPP